MGVRVKTSRPAVFVDRDGTLVKQVDDIIRFSQIKIFSGVPEGISILNKLGFLVVVVTNQPVIGKGLIDIAGVEKIHKALKKEICEKGGKIDAFYVCPHRYIDQCECRKPKLKLIKDAATKYNIDLETSFFIGDDMRDIETGRMAGMRTILVKTGKAGKDKSYFNTEPTTVAHNFLLASKFIARLRK